MKDTLTIKNQINHKPKLHYYLFSCWGLAVLSLIMGTPGEAYVAAGFVIGALIDIV